MAGDDLRAGGRLVARYLREDVILGSGYPWELMFLHSLKAIASWRSFASEAVTAGTAAAAGQGVRLGASAAGAAAAKGAGGSLEPSWVYNVVCAFVCHGFGGTTARDVAMGQAPSIFTSPQLAQTWLLAYAVVYWSPLDLAFQLISTPRTLTSLVVTTFEAVDSATTLCGSVEKAKRLFPDSPAAPFVAAMLASLGGSAFRYVERRAGRGWTLESHGVETEWSRPTEAFRRAIMYTSAYLLLSKLYGWRKARLWVATFHIGLSLTREVTGAKLDVTEGFL